MKKITITIILIVTLFAAAGVYYWNTRTHELKTYINKEIGISFKYPGNYDIAGDANSFLILCDDCDTQGEDIEIASHPNEKNLSAKEFAQRGIIFDAKNSGVEQTKLGDKEAWLLTSKSTKDGGLQFETIFTTLRNNKILEFGVGFENKDQTLYQDFQKIVQTVEFL